MSITFVKIHFKFPFCIFGWLHHTVGCLRKHNQQPLRVAHMDHALNVRNGLFHHLPPSFPQIQKAEEKVHLALSPAIMALCSCWAELSWAELLELSHLIIVIVKSPSLSSWRKGCSPLPDKQEFFCHSIPISLYIIVPYISCNELAVAKRTRRLVPSLSAPKRIKSLASSRLAIPPAALILRLASQCFRISATSSLVAPPVENPVEVFM